VDLFFQMSNKFDKE